MSKLTVCLLALLALVLGGGVYLQTQREQNYNPSQHEPLLGDGHLERVTGIRVDHIARDEQFELVRKDGIWHLVDPIEYPAEPAMVKLLLESLAFHADFVPDPEIQSLAKHFDPPRAMVFVTETMENGSTREHEIQVGELDVDGHRIEVRTRGQILRTMRNIDTAIVRPVSELRRQKLFTLRGQNLIRIERLGFNHLPGSKADLTFVADRKGANWVLTRPLDIQLDPTVTGLWGISLASVRADRFLSDIENPNLQAFGLDKPEITLRLTDRLGKVEEIECGIAESGGWCARRAGEKHIIQLDSGDLGRILQPGRELWDTRLLRAFRRDIAGLTLHRGEQASLRFEQDDKESWTVAQRPLGQDSFDLPVAADVTRIEGLLAILEQNEVEFWLDDPKDLPSVIFPKGMPRHEVLVDFRGVLEGEQQGGRLGSLREASGGTELQTFLRNGDQVVGLITKDLGAALEHGFSHWRSLFLWSLQEVRLKRLKISRGDRQREYTRKIQGTWRYSDVDATATELFGVLDSLIFLKATRHLAPEEAQQLPLEDVIRVEFQSVDGQTSVASLGLARVDGEEQVHAEVLGLRSLLRDQDLYAGLLELVK